MLKMLNAPETFLGFVYDGCHPTGIGCRPTFLPRIFCLAFQHFSPFLRFLVTNVSHQNTKLIRHPIFVTGLFVTIISISKQGRQTVSVSGRTRPFLSSYVHIQKQQ